MQIVLSMSLSQVLLTPLIIRIAITTAHVRAVRILDIIIRLRIILGKTVTITVSVAQAVLANIIIRHLR